MTGRVDIRFDMPQANRLKRRFRHPDGRDFTRGLRIAVESAMVQFLSKNRMILRKLIEREIKAQGFVLKQEHYQRDLDAYDMEMLQMKIWPRKTSGTTPEDAL